MAIAPLIVQVRTAGINQLRNLSAGFRQAGRAGSHAAAEMRRDFDRAVLALNRANAEVARTRREFNRAPSQETARAMHMAALAARMASREVDNLADQLRQANRQSRTLAAQMGAVAAAASTLGSGLPKGMAALAGIVVGMAPAIGAALQAGLLAALGGVGLGAAIFAAFKDADIRGAWQDTFKELGADVKNFAKQLGPALIESATMFRRAWRQAADGVRNLFGDLSVTIVPLTSGLIRMMQEAGPGIKKAFATAIPVLQELAGMLPALGRAISTFFSDISDKESALKGMRLIVLALAGSLIGLGKTIQALSAMFDFFSTIAEKVFRVMSVFGAVFGTWANILHAINNPAENLNGNLRIMSGTTLAAAQASREAAAAMQQLHNQMTAMINAALGVDDANLAWAAAVRGVTEAVKENGKSLDINTEKGAANVEAILAGVRAAEQKRQAAINMAGGENAAASAVAAANATFRQQIDQLAGLMRQLGFTESQIQGLLGKYYQLANAPNITKYVDIVYRTRGDAKAAGAVKSGNLAPGGPNLGYASGTPSAPKGWAWVGERGPELVNFGGGETVLNARASRRMANGGTASGGVTVRMETSPGGDSMVAGMINKMIRIGLIRLTVVNGQVRPV